MDKENTKANATEENTLETDTTDTATEQNTQNEQTEDAVQEKQPQEPDLQAELDSLKDKLLRLAAEYDNYKKRTQKEKESLSLEAKASVVNSLLPIVDNLDRAAGYSEDDPKKLREGLSLVLRQTQESLKTLGVEEIDSVGQKFDPNWHNAVSHIDDENFDENMVVEEFMKGYKLGDKVIRYSMVKVAN